MSVTLITGSSGLIGSESVRFLAEKGFTVVGIDNDMRRFFFGNGASTEWNIKLLQREVKGYNHYMEDIRDEKAMDRLFAKYGRTIEVIIHAAAQPSHDWADSYPMMDFTINANGTVVLLELTRKYCPDAVLIFTSTNKVYGDTPNRLTLVEKKLRWELDATHPYHRNGINESMSIDTTKHSLFGAYKLAADIMVQEYGRYFGMKSGVFRGGCFTGPAHSGTQLHGFLSYLAKCALTGTTYTIFGYKGKQVRDNIHSHDLVNAFWHFFQTPRPGEVYNMGGGRHSNCSVLEAIHLCEKFTGKKMNGNV